MGPDGSQPAGSNQGNSHLQLSDSVRRPCRTAGLCATIDEYVAGFGSRSKLDVSVSSLNPDIDRLAFELQRSLLRIAQEALANVHHHANASSVGLAIRMVSGCVRLIVRDNGQGRKGNSDRPTFGCGRGVTGVRAAQNSMAVRFGCGQAVGGRVSTLPCRPGWFTRRCTRSSAEQKLGAKRPAATGSAVPEPSSAVQFAWMD